jgi:hypothetical protein
MEAKFYGGIESGQIDGLGIVDQDWRLVEARRWKTCPPKRSRELGLEGSASGY